MKTALIILAQSLFATLIAEEFYLYHVKQKDFIGQTIYPLNMLGEHSEMASIYQRHCEKYRGREVDTIWIDKLDCGWHDVVFLSVIDPVQDYQARKEAGLFPEPREYFCIPVKNLEGKRVIMWDPPSLVGLSRFGDEHFVNFDPIQIREHSEIKEATKDYYRDCAYNKINPKTFHVHVIVRGPLDLSNARIIRWDEASSKIASETFEN